MIRLSAPLFILVFLALPLSLFGLAIGEKYQTGGDETLSLPIGSGSSAATLEVGTNTRLEITTSAGELGWGVKLQAGVVRVLSAEKAYFPFGSSGLNIETPSGAVKVSNPRAMEGQRLEAVVVVGGGVTQVVASPRTVQFPSSNARTFAKGTESTHYVMGGGAKALGDLPQVNAAVIQSRFPREARTVIATQPQSVVATKRKEANEQPKLSKSATKDIATLEKATQPKASKEAVDWSKLLRDRNEEIEKIRGLEAEFQSEQAKLSTDGADKKLRDLDQQKKATDGDLAAAQAKMSGADKGIKEAKQAIDFYLMGLKAIEKTVTERQAKVDWAEQGLKEAQDKGKQLILSIEKLGGDPKGPSSKDTPEIAKLRDQFKANQSQEKEHEKVTANLKSILEVGQKKLRQQEADVAESKRKLSEATAMLESEQKKISALTETSKNLEAQTQQVKSEREEILVRKEQSEREFADKVAEQKQKIGGVEDNLVALGWNGDRFKLDPVALTPKRMTNTEDLNPPEPLRASSEEAVVPEQSAPSKGPKRVMITEDLNPPEPVRAPTEETVAPEQSAPSKGPKRVMITEDLNPPEPVRASSGETVVPEVNVPLKEIVTDKGILPVKTEEPKASKETVDWSELLRVRNEEIEKTRSLEAEFQREQAKLSTDGADKKLRDLDEQKKVTESNLAAARAKMSEADKGIKDAKQAIDFYLIGLKGIEKIVAERQGKVDWAEKGLKEAQDKGKQLILSIQKLGGDPKAPSNKDTPEIKKLRDQLKANQSQEKEHEKMAANLKSILEAGQKRLRQQEADVAESKRKLSEATAMLESEQKKIPALTETSKSLEAQTLQVKSEREEILVRKEQSQREFADKVAEQKQKIAGFEDKLVAMGWDGDRFSFGGASLAGKDSKDPNSIDLPAPLLDRDIEKWTQNLPIENSGDRAPAGENINQNSEGLGGLRPSQAVFEPKPGDFRPVVSAPPVSSPAGSVNAVNANNSAGASGNASVTLTIN